MNHRELFLEVAHRIGRRLAAEALWDGDVCTWQVCVPDRSRPEMRQTVRERAGGAVYQGTAGITLFLGELYRYTTDAAVKHTAEGAMRHALKEAEAMPENRFGFYSGRVGIAYACARMAASFEKADYLQQASQILAPLVGNEEKDSGLDVIGGAAGAIPALLQLAEVLGGDWLVEIARRFGDHLIRLAHKEPIGWSWGGMKGLTVRNLCGLAHGASGCGHALLELYHATGSGRYLYAAEQAFLYERPSFDKQACNWPDFRHQKIGEYVFHGRIEELKVAVSEGRLPGYETSFMTAWCHGASGIGLTRLRAYELSGYPHYKNEAEAAIESTLTSLDHPGSNFSLCHGHGGNCETLLYGTEVFQAPDLRERAEQCGKRGAEVYEKAGLPWPCGTINAVSDPSLMLGEAGIGYFYLRLFSSATPSLLLLRAPAGRATEAPSLPGYRAQQKQYVDAYFGRTLRILEAGPETDPPVVAARTPDDASDASDVATAYRSLEAFISAQPEPRRALFEDAFLPDRARYHLQLTLTDFTQEYLHVLRKKPVDDVSWTRALFRLAPHTQIVQSRWDWDRWLKAGSTARAATPERAEVFFLLYRQDNQIHRRRLGPFAALILQCLEQPLSVSEAVSRVLESLQSPVERAVLQEKILDQLKQAYQANVVHRETALTPAGKQTRKAKKTGALV